MTSVTRFRPSGSRHLDPAAERRHLLLLRVRQAGGGGGAPGGGRGVPLDELRVAGGVGRARRREGVHQGRRRAALRPRPLLAAAGHGAARYDPADLCDSIDLGNPCDCTDLGDHTDIGERTDLGDPTDL